jgi:hypothetical protein
MHNAGSLITFYFKALGLILINLNRTVCRTSKQQQLGILGIISANCSVEQESRENLQAEINPNYI